MAAPLPARPNLEWLRKTAKDRLADIRKVQPQARLAEAQLALAREHGFSSWRALKAHVERLADAPAQSPSAETIVARFLELVGAGKMDEVRLVVTTAPALVNAVGPHPYWGGRPQALHVAIETTRRPMVQLLLEHGADIDGSNGEYDHWSPLMLAINRNCDDVRDDLIARGARIGLLEALMLADDAHVATALDSVGLPAIAPNRGSILAFARTPFAIDRLIALGAPIDVKDRWGARPIDALSRLGQSGAALVRHLETYGVTASPAEYARMGDQATLDRLAAADPSIIHDEAVMMAAVDFKHHDLVDWLLGRGARPNARSSAESRHTALHSAAWNGDLRMAEILLAAGADVTALDAQYNATPAGWAQTSVEVTNNAACTKVAEFLAGLS